MPVFTHKQFIDKNKIKVTPVNKSEEIQDKSTGVDEIDVNQTENKKVKKSIPVDPYKYFLLHPENGVNTLQNFEDTIILEGEEYKRECVGGVVTTTKKVLADFLLSKGYMLMEKVEVQ